jgi:trigger factor
MDVDGEIEKVRLRNARIENVERPAINGDTAVIDYDGYLNGVAFEGGHGENYELKLGSNTFIPGFEAKIQGMQIGEERDLDLTFPEKYHSEELAGKDVVFHVKLNELKSQVLPDADDEFAKDVSEFDTLAEYKDHIKEDLKTQREAQAQAEFENALIAKAAENMQADIPDALIDEYVEGGVENFSAQLGQYGMNIEAYLGMTGSSLDKFRESIRPQAAQQAKFTLVLEKIAEVEGVEATDEDIEAEYADVAAQYGMELDDAKQQVTKEYVVRRVKLNKAQKIVAESGVAEQAPAEETSAEGTEAEQTPAE